MRCILLLVGKPHVLLLHISWTSLIDLGSPEPATLRSRVQVLRVRDLLSEQRRLLRTRPGTMSTKANVHVLNRCRRSNPKCGKTDALHNPRVGPCQDPGSLDLEPHARELVHTPKFTSPGILPRVHKSPARGGALHGASGQTMIEVCCKLQVLSGPGTFRSARLGEILDPTSGVKASMQTRAGAQQAC